VRRVGIKERRDEDPEENRWEIEKMRGPREGRGDRGRDNKLNNCRHIGVL
jgi:hypothetical protein